MIAVRILFSLGLLGVLLEAQQPQVFQKPHPAILQLADAELPPVSLIDAAGRTLALLKRPAFQDLAQLAQPELRLAGLRLQPTNHNLARTRPYGGVALRVLETGQEIPMQGLPSAAQWEYPVFSPDGAHLALVEVQPGGLALWVVEVATGQAKRLSDPLLSAALGHPFVWAPDGKTLLARVRPSLEPLTERAMLPAGPVVQEAKGVKAPARTYQDLLRNPQDEARFEHYARVRVQRIDLQGQATPLLPPGLYRKLAPSPDGRFLLVSELRHPFSYTLPMDRFPQVTRVCDAQGSWVAVLAEKPLQDRIPVDFDAVETGRRGFGWREDAPATVTWIEALDGGDPRKDVPQRDAVFQLDPPFQAAPTLLWKTQLRCKGIQWGDAHTAVLLEGFWKTRRERTRLVNPSAPGGEGRVLFDRSTEDAYGDPGTFLMAKDVRHQDVLRFSKDHKALFLSGEGDSPQGSRPFLDRFELATGRSTRLWQAEGKTTYEALVRVLDPDKGVLLTRVEGPTTYPNLFLRSLGSPGALKPVTSFANPFAALAGVKKELLSYRRADGVALSATLYLPPNHDAARDGRLPVLMEAYPTEFKDSKTAGQLKTSPHRFIRPSYGSPIYWTLRGYAVLDETAFPIVGQGGQEPNDTYVEQLVANAKAAIDALDARGVGDPARVACMGHSYGAFMVANLLAHSDLFAAGIARSGAYNRTLTPFGFQSEERTYWQAPQLYHRMSPFDHADRIRKPLLLVHGDADNNPGTFTLQSERLFQAIQGLGGTARLVLLPSESHGYAARENILHLLWEQDQWLERHVKGLKPKP